MKQNTTESFRIEKDILDSIKFITQKTGQTSKGYIEIILRKQVEKDLSKLHKQNAKENNSFYYPTNAC
jgi:predicted DNA-binding protein